MLSLVGAAEERVPLASAGILVVISVLQADGDGAPLPVLEDDNAAMLTPVLLDLTSCSSSLTLSCSCATDFLEAPCFFEDDLLLFLDFEEDVVEVDLSSLALLDTSLLAFAFVVGSGFTFRASAAALARASVSFELGASTMGLV